MALTLTHARTTELRYDLPRVLDARRALVAALAVLTLGYIVYWIGSVRRRSREQAPLPSARPTLLQLAIGAVTNFFDTLGIGSFAPTTSIFKLRRLVPDELIPGTLNVGHSLPTITQAFIFIAIVEVEIPTLVGMIAASVLGAWVGAGIVAGLPRRKVQIGMGCALLAAASFFAMTNLGLLPSGGNTLGLTSPLLWVGIAGNFLLGALMTLGIGLYAPCMILVALLGMNPRAAFPIMMGSCAFLMPVGSARFIRTGSYSLAPAVGLTMGGIPAVLVAAFIVKSLPLTALRWLVVAVVAFASAAMLRSARADRRPPELRRT
ncbi:MAG: sulfite exporter TauE/SafE family protein [Thermoanaerobaculia bacterium]